MNESPADQLLFDNLTVAVKLWMDELCVLSIPVRRAIVRRWARDAATLLSERGDIVRYGGAARGKVAEAFNHMARGLAALAFCPGGVTFADIHFCADHSLCEQVDAEVAESMTGLFA